MSLNLPRRDCGRLATAYIKLLAVHFGLGFHPDDGVAALSGPQADAMPRALKALLDAALDDACGLTPDDPAALCMEAAREVGRLHAGMLGQDDLGLGASPLY